MIKEASIQSGSPFRLNLLWLLLAVCVLVLMAWVSLLLWNLPYYGLDSFDDPVRAPQGGRVSYVAARGSAAQSGIEKGDYLSVQDQRAMTYSPLSPFLTAEQTSAPVVARVGEPGSGSARTVTLLPVAAPFQVLVARLEAVGIALVFWVVSLVLLLLRPYHGVSRIFFLLGQLSAAMLATGSTGAVYYPGGGTTFRFLLIMVAAVALHFCATFPSPLHARWRTPLLASTYSVASLLIVLTVILPSFSVNLLPLSTLTLVSRLYVAVTLVWALGLLLSTRHKLSHLVLYKQRLLITGMIVSLLPVLALSFLPELLRGSTLVDYIWTFPALVLLPISYAYAVSQEALGRVDVLMNRSLVYGMLTVLLLLGYFMFSLILGWLIPAEGWSQPLTSGCLAIASVLLYSRARLRLQRWIDRIFFGGWYDYHSVTRAASATLSQASNLQQLLTRLTSITQSMRFQSAVLFLPEGGNFVPKGKLSHSASGEEDSEQGLPELPSTGQLARHLVVQDRPLQRANVKLEMTKRWGSLTESEQALLEIREIEYLLPLVSRGELRGVLALGKRQADLILSTEDIDILMLLAAQAAVAAENVGLVETLQARVTEMERIRSDLTDAQRRLAENQEVGRIRLAQELHDGAVQQLLGISYQLVRSRGSGENGHSKSNGNSYANGTNGTNGIGHDVAGDTIRYLAEPGAVDDREFSAKSYTHAGPAIDPASAPEIDLDSIRHEMLSVVTQLRGLIGELRPPGLEEFGVVTAIEGYVSRLRREAQNSRRYIPDIYLDLPTESLELSRTVALCLFRTTQEAIRNALKHANANSINIRLQVKPGEVALCVSDDGDGFSVPSDLSKLALHEHYGLIGIAERVEWVNGTLSVESQEGEGTKLTVCVPLAN